MQTQTSHVSRRRSPHLLRTSSIKSKSKKPSPKLGLTHPHFTKHDFPVSEIRRFLEPGPIVLVSSSWKGQDNIMTMGWHTVLEFTPSLIGCMITSGNHSYEMIRRSKECVINIPTVDLIHEVVGIGNCSGGDHSLNSGATDRPVDKFKKFGLTKRKASRVKAPLIEECYANLECRVVDTRMLTKYNFFILEVVKAHAPRRPKYPETIHYRGDGIFMIAGGQMDLHREFRPEML